MRKWSMMLCWGFPYLSITTPDTAGRLHYKQSSDKRKHEVIYVRHHGPRFSLKLRAALAYKNIFRDSKKRYLRECRWFSEVQYVSVVEEDLRHREVTITKRFKGDIEIRLCFPN
ncbi:hypothetical protein ROHU_005803 [Labeo rohita]|uniref:Uncharacterized protein n=1 Tax=Labeo rohita TaxID=84645 RepID=A0A498N2P0_LABRO|nr:hypothetical protein ROHU_005803 [Labeo rohita]